MQQKIDFEEAILIRILSLSPLMPHYWSDFFVNSRLLLSSDEEIQLGRYIRDVERFVLEEDYWFNFFRCKSCGKSFQTEDDWYMVSGCRSCKSRDIELVSEKQTLYDIEMAIESNRDFTAYFEKYGTAISKFDVERRLNKIKEWIFTLIKERAKTRRFKRL